MTFGIQVFNGSGVPLVASQDRLTRLIGTYAATFAAGVYQVDVAVAGLLAANNFSITSSSSMVNSGTFSWVTDGYLHVYCGDGAAQTLNTDVFSI